MPTACHHVFPAKHYHGQCFLVTHPPTLTAFFHLDQTCGKFHEMHGSTLKLFSIFQTGLAFLPPVIKDVLWNISWKQRSTFNVFLYSIPVVVWDRAFLPPRPKMHFKFIITIPGLGVFGGVWSTYPPPPPPPLVSKVRHYHYSSIYIYKVKLSLRVVVGGGKGGLNITSTTFGTFFFSFETMSNICLHVTCDDKTTNPFYRKWQPFIDIKI